MDKQGMIEMSEKFLAAWCTQDVEAVLDTYTEDVVYRDPNTRGEVHGRDAMRRYLTKLFSAWTMTWALREAHLYEGGDGCNVLWHATFSKAGGEKVVECDGMDLVFVRDGKVCRNEVQFDRAVLAGLM